MDTEPIKLICDFCHELSTHDLLGISRKLFEYRESEFRCPKCGWYTQYHITKTRVREIEKTRD